MGANLENRSINVTRVVQSNTRSPQVRILSWNLAWARGSTTRGQLLLAQICKVDPDIAVLTEVTIPFVEKMGGNFVLSDSDYGYKSNPARRKVAIWSKTKINNPDIIGTRELPTGRFASGYSEDLMIIGVCIPWSGAHVSTGRKNRKKWEDHLDYVRGLKTLVAKHTRATVIAGDFNQRHPRRRQPKYAHESLRQALTYVRWTTEGQLTGIGEQTIDHVVTSRDLKADNVFGLSKKVDGIRLSDQFGVFCSVCPNPQPLERVE